LKGIGAPLTPLGTHKQQQQQQQQATEGLGQGNISLKTKKEML
jgi:hypothetical protein